MKKLLSTLILATLIALPATQASALFGLPKTFKGQVQYVDQNLVSVSQLKNNQTKEMVFQVNQETKLGEISSIDNLKAGDEITVEYKEEEGSNIAVSIAPEKAEAGADAAL